MKEGRSLEALGTADVVAFDKTRTLTTGGLTAADVISGAEMNETELLRVVRGIGARSDHPIAEAIVEYAAERNVALVDVTQQ